MSIEHKENKLWDDDEKKKDIKEVKILKGNSIPEELEKEYKEKTLNEGS